MRGRGIMHRRGTGGWLQLAVVMAVVAGFLVVARPAHAAFPEIGFLSAETVVSESGSSFDVEVTIQLTTGGAPLGPTLTFDVVDAGTGSAIGTDYAFATTSRSFLGGVDGDLAIRTVSVTISPDALPEDQETVDLAFANIANGDVDALRSTHQIKINDDGDPQPQISISDDTVDEGDQASFDVTLNTVSGQTVTVQYATANGTAVAPGDYVAKSGTVTFLPGDTSETVTVDTNTDGVASEGNENFTVGLSSASNATISDPTGTGTIQDATALPTVSIADAGSVVEGGVASFVVTLSASLGSTATVQYATANGSAAAPGDYTAKNGTVTFLAGDTSELVTVNTVNDALDEPAENFSVVLSSPSNATIGDGSGSATITDNDNPPSVSIADGSAVEGNGTMTFNVTLSGPSGFTTSVNYATTPGTALTPADFGTTSGTVTFTAGDIAESFTVPIVSDSLDEPDEVFTVNLSSPSLLAIGDGAATGTINDDDPIPTLSVNSVQAEEGLPVAFTVTLSAASGRTVTVNRATANGTATAPGDYTTLPSAALTFTPGQTVKTVNVTTIEDTTNEANETFTLVLSGATNATIAAATGTGTILNDDGPPGLSALDATPAAEGSAGLVFNVSLLPASGQTVRVNYATADGTAKAASDYTTSTGFVEFAPGQTIKPVTVPITNDATDEITEALVLNLSAPVNAAIADAQAVGSILDNDNVAPTITTLEALDQANNPTFQFGTGDVVKLRASFTDLGIADTHSVTVNWGDGTAPATFPMTPVGARSFERTHMFAAEGFYQISVSVADGDGGSGSDDYFITVSGPGVGVTDDTIGLVDPTRGVWRLYTELGVLATEFYYGNPGDYPFMGDWDGDGISTPGLYRQSDGYVYLRNSNTVGIADIKFFFGNPGDVPIAGDFNNDGFDTVSIYRPSNQTFYIINKLGSGDQGLGAADFSYVFGNPGDKPFVGDFDGDGIDTAGLHRESTGLVYFRNSHTQGNADHQFIYGDPNDQLVAGDWTGDGVDSPTIYRSSDQMIYIRYTNTQGHANATWSTGVSGWIPVAGVTGTG